MGNRRPIPLFLEVFIPGTSEFNFWENETSRRAYLWEIAETEKLLESSLPLLVLYARIS